MLARKHLPELVYGANDGLVTTFAIVSGVVGADLPPRIVVVLGFASLIADGISMGASEYLASRSRTGVEQITSRLLAGQRGMVTTLSFVVVGAAPLLAYVVPISADRRFAGATILTLFTLFGVGAARALVTRRSWFKSGVEMLIVGSAAAAVAYVIGAYLAELSVGR